MKQALRDSLIVCLLVLVLHTLPWQVYLVPQAIAEPTKCYPGLNCPPFAPPHVLYKEGRYAFENGDCETAITLLTRFLNRNASKRLKHKDFFDVVEEKIKECQSRLQPGRSTWALAMEDKYLPYIPPWKE